MARPARFRTQRVLNWECQVETPRVEQARSAETLVDVAFHDGAGPFTKLRGARAIHPKSYDALTNFKNLRACEKYLDCVFQIHDFI